MFKGVIAALACASLAGGAVTAQIPSDEDEALQAARGLVGKHLWMKFDTNACDARNARCRSHRGALTVIAVQMLTPPGKGSTAIPYLKAKFDDDASEGFMPFMGAWALTSVDPSDCRQRGHPRIGMTRDEVRETCWGQPENVNSTETAAGTYDQLVYSRGRYLYVTNGVVTAIQEIGQR